MFGFVPPKKQEFPLAFPAESIQKRKYNESDLVKAKNFDLDSFLRR